MTHLEAFCRGRRVYYDATTDTIRQSPEGYTLLVKRDGRWLPQADDASPVNNHSLRSVLANEAAGLDGDELAEAIEISIWGCVEVMP